MNTDLRDQIYRNFKSKDTEELLDIWETNDRQEWSDLAFEVLQEVLTERVGSLPEQNSHILEKNEEESLDDLEEWEARLLDNEDQPQLYDTLEVIDLIENINKVAKAAIVIYIVVYIISSSAIQAIFAGGLSSLDEAPSLIWNLFTVILVTALQIAFVYFPLKALSHILRILMEMEFNSRKR